MIIGTKQRDHTKLMPFMIMMCIGIVIAFVQMFAVLITGIIIGILTIVLDVYFLVCTYSLYDKFRNEKLASIGNAYVYPQQTIIYSAAPPAYDHPQIRIEPPTLANTPDAHATASAPAYDFTENSGTSAHNNKSFDDKF